MRACNQNINQNKKNIGHTTELFKQALNEALERKFNKEIAECQEPIEISDNHKRWMNRFFSRSCWQLIYSLS